jgi:hypothetical protein
MNLPFYSAPNGLLDRAQVVEHTQQVKNTWAEPGWVYRTNQLKTLMEWCVRCAQDEAIRREVTAAELDNALYQALRFGDDVHAALNPEGSNTLREMPMPPRDVEDR